MEPIDLFAEFYGEALEKVAAAKADSGRTRVGFRDLNRAAMLANQRSKTGVGQYINSNEQMKRVGKAGLKGGGVGLAAGAPIGALLGALAGRARGRAGMGAKAGVLGGSLFGGLIGANVGEQKEIFKSLREKGIYPKWHGFSGSLSPDANRKLKAYRKMKAKK